VVEIMAGMVCKYRATHHGAHAPPLNNLPKVQYTTTPYPPLKELVKHPKRVVHLPILFPPPRKNLRQPHEKLFGKLKKICGINDLPIAGWLNAESWFDYGEEEAEGQEGQAGG